MYANPLHPQTYELVDAAAKGLGVATVRVVAGPEGEPLGPRLLQWRWHKGCLVRRAGVTL
jgi:hypothetical protein